MSIGVIFLVFLLTLPVILITLVTLGEREDPAERRAQRIEDLERALGLDICEWSMTRGGVKLRCCRTRDDHARERAVAGKTSHLDPVHGYWRPQKGECYDLSMPRTVRGIR